jgi:tRNA A-37 threonylcarbamoyl transferase component Bud32
MCQSRPHLTIQEGIVTKRVPAEWVGLEVGMTRAAHDLGRDCGLFLAPCVIGYDARNGLIQFEQFTSLVRVSEYLRTSPNDLELMRSIGRAIAMVHERLRISPELTLISSRGSGDLVPLHGDFSTSNVCVKADTQQVVLLDWSSANALPQKITVGPRHIDLAQFLRSLVVHSTPFRAAFRWFPARAAAFLEGYEVQSGRRIDLSELCRYVNWINATHLRGVLRNSPGLRVLPQMAKCCVTMVFLRGQTHKLRWGTAEARQPMTAGIGA